eukprot:3309569-Amphidinium_carterae.1
MQLPPYSDFPMPLYPDMQLPPYSDMAVQHHRGRPTRADHHQSAPRPATPAESTQGGLVPPWYSQQLPWQPAELVTSPAAQQLLLRHQQASASSPDFAS